MDLVSFKKRYMPSKKIIKEIKENYLLKNPDSKFSNEWYTRLVIGNKWGKLKKEDLPMLYKDIATSIIDDINKFCTVENIEFGDCYFIFYKGDNSVIHFKIKELKGWKFGMWFSKENDNTIKCEWFCRYELCLDKFRPNRSEIHCETFWNVPDYIGATLFDEDLQSKNDFYWEGQKIYENIRFMLDNPYLALYRDCFGTDLNLKYISKRYAKRQVKKEIKECKTYDKMEEKLQQKMKNKVVKEIRKTFDDILDIQAIDRNVDGCVCSPRFKLELTVKNGEPEMYSRCENLIDSTQDKLSHKRKFDKYSVYSVVDNDVKIFKTTPFGKVELEE